MTAARKPSATPDFLQSLGRVLVQGAVDAGNRAVASAVRSVVKDGKKLMKQTAKKLEEVEIRASDLIGDQDDESDDGTEKDGDLPDGRVKVVDAEFEPTTKTKRKKTRS